MSASPDLLSFVAAWESCVLVAYLDGGNPPVPTIAYGHTRGVRMGDTCTQAQADAWLLAELDAHGDELTHYLTRAPTQQQFDALTSLGYNAGVAPPHGIGPAGIVALFNAGDDAGCANRFRAWNRDGGVIVRGLTKRREAERAIYLAGDYSGRP